MDIQKIKINNKEVEGICVPTQNTIALLIKANKGILACGYFDIKVANKVGDAMAIVTGVKNFDDMLLAKVCKVSDHAKNLGVEEGMSGKEALERML